MFSGFTKQTSQFFWDLAFNNERSWFLEHKDEFERDVNLPFKALAGETMQLMERRWPDRELSLHVSRIYKDARRLHGSGPYKNHLWFSIKSSAALLEGPMFWFEVGAKDYAYGMGFYSATARQMAAFRQSIDANPARFARIAEAVEAQPDFTVTGEEYSRSKGSYDGVIARWYNRKRVGVEVDRDFGGDALSEKLPELLCDAYDKLMPLYDFFVEFYRMAPPEERERRT